MLFNDIAVRRLGILHQGAAAVTVDIHRHKAPVEPRDAECAQERVGGLLPLQAGIVARPVARLVNLVKGSCPQERIVIGEDPLVMAEASVRCVKALVVRAAGETSLGVVNDAVAIDDGAIVALVAKIR